MSIRKRWVGPVLREYTPSAMNQWHLQDRAAHTMCGLGPVLGWNDYHGGPEDPEAAKQCEACVVEMVKRALTRPGPVSRQTVTGRLSSGWPNLSSVPKIRHAVNYGLTEPITVQKILGAIDNSPQASSPSPHPASGGSSKSTPDE